MGNVFYGMVFLRVKIMVGGKFEVISINRSGLCFSKVRGMINSEIII